MIEVITGPMFSGKTAELIKRLNQAKEAGLKHIVFKPEIESRNEAEQNAIATHDKSLMMEATPVPNSVYIVRMSKEYDVVAIDEAQFFDTNLYLVAKVLNDAGKRVIISGLDMDYGREPFDTMGRVLAVANQIDKYAASCHSCQKPAQYSKRTIKFNERVLIGGDDKYIAQCHECYSKK
jgi:thymidine kinase